MIDMKRFVLPYAASVVLAAGLLKKTFTIIRLSRPTGTMVIASPPVTRESTTYIVFVKCFIILIYFLAFTEEALGCPSIA